MMRNFGHPHIGRPEPGPRTPLAVLVLLALCGVGFWAAVIRCVMVVLG